MGIYNKYNVGARTYFFATTLSFPVFDSYPIVVLSLRAFLRLRVISDGGGARKSHESYNV